MASKTTYYGLDMPGYNDIADIDVINGNMSKIDEQMKKNADSAQQSKYITSDEYSATKTYAVGDYCIRENVLYKCKTAITTGEAFDSNKWIQTTCGTEFRELSSNLSQLEYSDISGGKNFFKWKNPKVVERNGITFDATQNGKIKLSGTTTVNLLANAFIDLTFTLSKGTYTISVSNGENIFCIFNANGNNEQILSSMNGIFTLTEETEMFFGKWTASGTVMNYDIEVMIVEGTQATPYEPYIPSVKMLADENSQQNTETMDLKMLGWTVPSECPIQNYVDSDGVFHQRVGRVDLSTLSFIELGNFGYYVEIPTSKAPINNSTVANIYLEGFTTVKRIDLDSSPNSIAMTGNKEFCINNGKIAIPSGYLYYELETPITMNIDGNEAVTKIKNDLGGLIISDLNNATTFGSYTFLTTSANSPKSGYVGSLLVLSNVYTIHQIAFMGNDSIYMRRKNNENGIWNEWKSITLS